MLMLKNKTILIFIIFLICAFSTKTGYSANVLRVAITEFKNTSGYSGEWHIGSGMADMLATALVKTNKFDVIERQQIAAAIKEQQLSETDLMEEGTAPQIGKLIGADVIIFGNVTEFGIKQSGVDLSYLPLPGIHGVRSHKQAVRVAVDVRLIDAETGRIIAAESAEAEHSSSNLGLATGIGAFDFGSRGFDETSAGKATRQAIDTLVKKIVAALYKPKIASVEGSSVTVTIGRNDDVAIGDIFKVVKETTPIIDPDTNRVLGYRKMEIGKIKITSTEPTYSEGILLEGEASVGDLVEKIEEAKPASKSRKKK